MEEDKKNYHRINLGKWGEEVAVDFLSKKGYRILGRNIKVGRGELDILSWNNNQLIIVEVKTKTSSRFGEPAEEVDGKKIEQINGLMERLVFDYKKMRQLRLKRVDTWQIDILAVYGDGRRVFDIIHYENVGVWG